MTLFRGKRETPPPPLTTLKAGKGGVEPATLRIGREMLGIARRHRAGLLSARFWSDQWMDWAMKDPAFKVQLFRFVDVFPMLGSPEKVHDYLVDYLGQPGVTLPPAVELGQNYFLAVALEFRGRIPGTHDQTLTQELSCVSPEFPPGQCYLGIATGTQLVLASWATGN